MSLRRPDGTELTPRSRKAQGILALLGTSPDRKRSRTWLQDKLWSDRGPEQGAASLRQCLSELRRSFAEHTDCLRTDAVWIALDPVAVAVRTSPVGHDNGPPAARTEFLEGLDIRDPEFEDWLRDQRLAFADRALAVGVAPAEPAPPPLEHNLRHDGPLLLVDPTEGATDRLRLFGDMLADGIAGQIAAAGNAQIVSVAPPAALLPRLVGLRVRIRATDIGNNLLVQIRLTSLDGQAIIWIGLKEIEPHSLLSPIEGPLHHWVGEAASIAIDALGRGVGAIGDAHRAALTGYRAIRHAPLLDLTEQRVADELLSQAFETNPLGIFLARRAMLRHTAFIERMSDLDAEATEQAVEMARRALELDPTNATVVAAASEVAVVIEGKIQGGIELARRALALDSGNALAWASLAHACARSGSVEEAHRAALRARTLAASLPQTSWWDMVCCLTATVSGRYDDAIRFGEVARDLAPTFKPPLRYLAALYFQRGDAEQAARHFQKLKDLEGDFSLDLLRSETYPVASLRRTPLIAVAESKIV